MSGIQYTVGGSGFGSRKSVDSLYYISVRLSPLEESISVLRQ